MRTYKLTIAYDGTRYQGWQRQSATDMTVQTQLEKALSEVIGYPVEIHGSGRTDAGVHAMGQTAHMKVSGKLDEKLLTGKVNALLPDDIRIRKVELAKNSFHSRYKAKAKKYIYCVDFRERPDVFGRKYCYHLPESLNIPAMKEASCYLKGEHDFAAFTDLKTDKSTTRKIYDIDFEIRGHKLWITFYGTGFLYHMVRILTGTLLEVGMGKRSQRSVQEALKKKERSEAGFLAPSEGLFLKEVIY
jgi:tRNA pseudouridine38-40 synthase